MLVEFTTEDVTKGCLCVWDTITKMKLKTSNARIEINAGGM